MPRVQYWKLHEDLFDGEVPLRTFVGGMRHGLMNWTPPMVRLSVYRTGVVFGPATGLLRAVVPYWQLRFDEVTGVEWVTNWLMFGTGGVRFWLSDGDYRIFWTSRWGEILGGLGQLGLPVDPERHAFHPFDPWL